MRARDSSISLILLIAIAGVPVTVGAYIFARPAPAPPRALSPPVLVAQADPRTGPSARRPDTAPPLALGTLYINGSARIAGAAGEIPFEKGRYLYLGGETVSTAGNSLGVLRVAGAGTVYVCPDSTVRVVRRGGEYLIALRRGGLRFLFAPGVPFRVEVNRMALVPAGPEPGGRVFEGEVVTSEGETVALWDISGRYRIETESAAGNVTEPGAIYRWPGPPGAAGEAREGERVPVPDVVSTNLVLPDGAAREPRPYLCRAEAIETYARFPLLPPTAAGPEPADRGDAEAPPTELAQVPPEVAPRVSVPEAAGPDPLEFDPNLLEPPGAGLPAPTQAPVIFSVAPAIPAGTGGIAASPS